MPSDLWTFALRLYARPGVEAACLQLQARGADICLLLCGSWLEHTARDCTAARCAALQQLAQPWQQQVITPLRQLRQDWRTAAQQQPALAALREQVKQLELQAERELLEQLQHCAEAWPSSATQTPSDWLESLGAGVDSPDALLLLRAEARRA